MYVGSVDFDERMDCATIQVNSLYFHQPKNVSKDTSLQIATNTSHFIIGGDVYCFYRSLVSSVVLACNGRII